MKELLGLGVLAWPLVLLVAILLGFVIAILFGVAYAKRHGKRAWLWAMLAFLVVFLPIFWDWIPTVVAHKYYCATEAGFWIYKTPEQWKKDNPQAMENIKKETQDWKTKYLENWKIKNPGASTAVIEEDLMKNNVIRSAGRQGDMENYTDTQTLNSRFNSINKKSGPFFLHLWRWEDSIVDVETNEVLAKYVNFSSGNGFITSPDAPLKFWLQKGYCDDGKNNGYLMDKYFGEIKGLANEHN